MGTSSKALSGRTGENASPALGQPVCRLSSFEHCRHCRNRHRKPGQFGQALVFPGVSFIAYVSIVFFSPGATARGYLAYSSAFILFASLIALVFQHARGGRMAKAVGTVAAAGSVIVQMAWSLAVYFGYFFPAVAFYCGPSIGGQA